ncbi:hypothetical protein EIP91_006527 [Steccherinum ochraceum]|uniref:Uncharacterized protein n=1 Tax=Steccherinum ochraceum TaxID=92696 RepID=A0A4R0R5S4_9APHY|nr:hypothetical protein EIP91_006527 [Steccherinum ochraceum]
MSSPHNPQGDEPALSPLGLSHLGPSPLPNFTPINIGAPLPRRALKPVPLPDVPPNVAMPGDHLGKGKGKVEEAPRRDEFAFHSEIDVEEDVMGRRNRPRLDAGPEGHNREGYPARFFGNGEQGKRHGTEQRRTRRSVGSRKSLVAAHDEVLQSITCSPELAQYSFEELRVECYAKSYIATSGPPPPADPERGQFIPPAFTPFVSPTSPLLLSNDTLRDVAMSDQSSFVSAFTFNMSPSAQHI